MIWAFPTEKGLLEIHKGFVIFFTKEENALLFLEIYPEVLFLREYSPEEFAQIVCNSQSQFIFHFETRTSKKIPKRDSQERNPKVLRNLV